MGAVLWRRGLGGASALVLSWVIACGESQNHEPGGTGNRAGHAGAATSGKGGTGSGTSGKGGTGSGTSGMGGTGGTGQSGRSGQSGTGAASGDGGAADGGAGQSGSGGTGVAGAGAGTGGAGEGGSSTSQCHAAPDLSPTLPSTTELDPELVARAAAVWGSCAPDDGVDRNAFGIWAAAHAAPRVYYRLGEQLDCLAHADCGCGALEHCFDWRLGREDTCTSGCDGSVWTSCTPLSGLPGFRLWNLDCARFGLTCDDEAGCIDEPPTACSSSPRPTCTTDGALESCDDGYLRHTPPCSDAGLTCEDGQCTGSGADCDDGIHTPPEEVLELFGTGCAGDTLEHCANGKSASIDCATQGTGFGCQSSGGSFFCGLADECVPPAPGQGSSTAPVCDGTVLRFCNMGRIDSVDCTSLGFDGCEIDHSVAHYGCIPTTTD